MSIKMIVTVFFALAAHAEALKVKNGPAALDNVVEPMPTKATATSTSYYKYFKALAAKHLRDLFNRERFPVVNEVEVDEVVETYRFPSSYDTSVFERSVSAPSTFACPEISSDEELSAVGVGPEYPVPPLTVSTDPNHQGGFDGGAASQVVLIDSTGRYFIMKVFNKDFNGKQKITKLYKDEMQYFGLTRASKYFTPFLAHYPGNKYSFGETMDGVYGEATPTDEYRQIWENEWFADLDEQLESDKRFKGRKVSDYPAILSPFRQGGDLFDFLVNNGSEYGANSGYALRLLQSMMRSVSDLHKLGYVHKDIKPENFVVNGFEQQPYEMVKDGELVQVQVPVIEMIDFGFTKHVNDPEIAISQGTMQYLAPEINSKKHMDMVREFNALAEEDVRYYAYGFDLWSVGQTLVAYLVNDRDFNQRFETPNSKKLMKVLMRVNQEESDLPIVRDNSKLRKAVGGLLQFDFRNRASTEEVMEFLGLAQDF